MFPGYGKRYRGAPEVNAGNSFPLGHGQHNHPNKVPKDKHRSFYTHMSDLSVLYIKILVLFGAIFLLYFAGIKRYI